MSSSSYSIGFKLSGAGSIEAMPKLPDHLMRPPVYQSVTLSPAPAAAGTQAHDAPAFDDDFFEIAFEGIDEALTAESEGGVAPDASPTPAALRGYLEDCSRDRIAGWAQDPRAGAPPVRVAIMLGRIVLADLLADSWRADLSTAGIGTGHHAFEFRPAPPIASDLLSEVRVVCVAGKAELPRLSNRVSP